MRKPIVKSVSILDTIEILGHKIQGYEAIHNAVEVCSSRGSSTVDKNWEEVVVYEPYIKTRNPKVLIPGLHVLEVSDCFMYFDEYYWEYSFFFSERPFTKEEITRFACMRNVFNPYCIAEWALPAVTYNGCDIMNIVY